MYWKWRRGFCEPRRNVCPLKKLLLASRDNSIEQQMAMETEEMASLAASPDFQEGIRAFAGKRAPRFGSGSLR
jgi:2-(1,2-epoxy-1,2-dihydrophenyl)acetyl-CoA isomerase